MINSKQIKIFIKDEKESKLIQEQLFRLGYEWKYNFTKEKYLHTEAKYLFAKKNKSITMSNEDYVFKRKKNYINLTLKELERLKSISELISEQIVGKRFNLQPEIDFVNAYYKGEFKVVLSNFHIDFYIDCQIELGQMKGEEEVGFANGSYIDNTKEISVNVCDNVVYFKNNSNAIVLAESEKDKINELIIQRIIFIN